MLLAETVIQLCAMAERREGAKERGSRVRTNKDNRKGAGREGQTRHSHCHSPQEGIGGAGPGRERLREVCVHDAVIYF